MVEEAVIQGLPIEELFGHIWRTIKFMGSQKIKEHRKAIGIAVDEVLIGIVIGLKIPALVEHGSEQGIPAGIGESCGRRFEDSASNIKSHPVFLDSHDRI